jgi:hypothetical protein
MRRALQHILIVPTRRTILVIELRPLVRVGLPTVVRLLGLIHNIKRQVLLLLQLLLLLINQVKGRKPGIYTEVHIHKSTEGRVIGPTMLRFDTSAESALGVSYGLEVAHPHAVL